MVVPQFEPLARRKMASLAVPFQSKLCTSHGISVSILIFSKTNNSTTSMGLFFSPIFSPFRWTFYVTAHRIEETFKVTKNELKARPVFLSTEKHIRAHFLICFVTLLLMRLLEYRLAWK
jgi:hypothetical protein